MTDIAGIEAENFEVRRCPCSGVITGGLKLQQSARIRSPLRHWWLPPFLTGLVIGRFGDLNRFVMPFIARGDLYLSDFLRPLRVSLTANQYLVRPYDFRIRWHLAGLDAA